MKRPDTSRSRDPGIATAGPPLTHKACIGESTPGAAHLSLVSPGLVDQVLITAAWIFNHVGQNLILQPALRDLREDRQRDHALQRHAGHVVQTFQLAAILDHGRSDSFCLAGGQSLRAVYASPDLVRAAIARADRAKVSGRVVLILTATRRYAIKGIHPGIRLTGHIALGRALVVGRTTWYVIPGVRANGLVEVRGGTVIAVGIADTRLSTGRATAKRLLSPL